MDAKDTHHDAADDRRPEGPADRTRVSITADALESLLHRRAREDTRAFDLLRRLEIDGASDPTVVKELVDALESNLEERQVAEEELRASSQQLEEAFVELLEQRRRDRELFEHAPVAYLVSDEKGIIRDCNHLAARWIGETADRLAGRPLTTVVAEPDRQSVRQWLNALASTGNVDVGAFRLKTLRGVVLPVRVSVSVVRGHDGRAESLRWVVVPAAPPSSGPWPEPAPVHADVPLRAIIAHHDDLYVHGLKTLLTASFGVHVRIATTRTIEEIDDLLDDGPHAALLEITEGDIPRLQRLRKQHPRIRILAIVAGGPEAQLAALAAGADSVLPATTSPNELLGPLLGTANHWVTMPRGLADDVLGQALQRHTALQGLEPEERLLLQRISEGATTADVADELHLSPRTVKRRLATLYRKLGVETRAEAIALAGRSAGLPDASSEGRSA